MHIAIKALVPGLLAGGAIGQTMHSFGAGLEYGLYTWLAALLLAALARDPLGKFLLVLTGLSVFVVLLGLGGDGADDSGGDC